MARSKVYNQLGPYCGKLSYKMVPSVVGTRETIEFLNNEMNSKELEPYKEACYLQAINVLTNN